MTATMMDNVADENASRAAALAMEALRLAEEAKRAADRVAEIKATLSIKSSATSPRFRGRPTPETPIVETRDARQTRRLSSDPPTNTFDPPANGSMRTVSDFSELRKDASVDINPETRNSAPTLPAPIPTVAPASVVPEAQKPNVVDEGIVEKAPVAVTPVPAQAPVPVNADQPESTDLFVRVLDAFGVDRLCGVDEATLNAAMEAENRKLNTVRSNRSEAAPVIEQQPATTENTHASPSRPVGTNPPAAPAAAPVVAVAPVVAPMPAAPAVAPLETVAPAALTAPENRTPPPAAAPVVAYAPVQGAVEQPANDNASTAREETRKQVRARTSYSHVLRSPDPFGGDHDDFMPCGCADDPLVEDTRDYYVENKAVAPEHVPEEEQPEHQPLAPQGSQGSHQQADNCCGI